MMEQIGGGSASPAPDMANWLKTHAAPPSRLRYTALLLAGLGVASVAGSLLVGEADLPFRTRAALATVTGGGIAWALFAGWVLARRRVLFARHRVIAAGMAVVFSLLFTGGAWAVGLRDDAPNTGLAVGMGVGMLALATFLLLRARRRVRELVRRRREVEAQLRRQPPA